MIDIADEILMQATPEDWEFYNRCVEGLPTMAGENGDGKDKYGEFIPYGSGPHILKWFKEAIEIVQPKNILEIGLNCGHGAAMLLEMTGYDTTMFSIDISDRDETIEAGNLLKERYFPKFDFAITHDPFSLLKGVTFDLCWLDGGHDEESVTKDIEACIRLNIPYILADDWLPRFGPGVEPSFAKFPQYKMVRDMNNIKLFKWEN